MMIEEYEYDMGEMKISLLFSLSLSGFVFQECVGGIARVVEGIICVLHFFSSLCAFWSWVWVWVALGFVWIVKGGGGWLSPHKHKRRHKNQHKIKTDSLLSDSLSPSFAFPPFSYCPFSFIYLFIYSLTFFSKNILFLLYT